ncbi:MAG: hypothetical protein R3185_00935 [Candidatus Thermoplasmatota archaeon]|nr:hypothetical protein [Candidatus Thermoplasmatota archaeon]
MAWTGITMGLGVLLLALGALGLITGVAVAIVGPEVVTDETREHEEEGLVTFGDGSDHEERRAAEQRQEIRLAGGLLAGIGAAVALLGAVLLAISRGVEAHHRTRPVEAT